MGNNLLCRRLGATLGFDHKLPGGLTFTFDGTYTKAIEAPFIVHHRGYFYLFTSWDLCCRGLKSSYKTMVGRSKSITGPYMDTPGKLLTDGGGTPLLIGNKRWLGPGGESILLGRKDKDLIVFHAYDAKTGKPSMQLSTIDWGDGWPHAALEQ